MGVTDAEKPTRISARVLGQAVRLATSAGNTLSGVARDLGVSLESLRKWIRLADVDAGRLLRQGDPTDPVTCFRFVEAQKAIHPISACAAC